MARISYENDDHFGITWEPSDHVKIDSNFKNPKGFDRDKWNEEVSDWKLNVQVKLSIDNAYWIIEKWIKDKNEPIKKYGRSMKNAPEVEVVYGWPP
jgi:hypothetical protein